MKLDLPRKDGLWRFCGIDIRFHECIRTVLVETYEQLLAYSLCFRGREPWTPVACTAAKFGAPRTVPLVVSTYSSNSTPAERAPCVDCRTSDELPELLLVCSVQSVQYTEQIEQCRSKLVRFRKKFSKNELRTTDNFGCCKSGCKLCLV